MTSFQGKSMLWKITKFLEKIMLSGRVLKRWQYLLYPSMML
jgi:hypothetical protein